MDKVIDFLVNEVKLKEGDTIVLGNSGGPDSMCLLTILLRLREKYHLKNMPAQKFVELVLNAIDNKSFDAISQLYNFVMKNFLITDFILKSEIK